jgi:hypothetical protein
MSGNAQQATMHLKQAFDSLAVASGERAMKAQVEVGKILGRNFSVFNAATGKTRGLVGIVRDLNEAYEKADPNQRMMLGRFMQHIVRIGGVTGMMQMMNATLETNTGEVLKGADALGYMEKTMENVSGESETAAKTIKEQWGFFRQWMTSMGTLFLVKFGQPLVEVLNKYVRPVLEVIIKGLMRFVEQHPGLVKIVTVFTLIATAVALVLGPMMMVRASFLLLGKLLGTTFLGLLKSTVLSFRFLGASTTTASGGFWTLNASMLPTYAWIMLIVGAIWAMIRAWNTWKVPRAERKMKELAAQSEQIYKNIKLYKEQFETQKMSASMYQEKMKEANISLSEIEKKNRKLGGFMEAYSKSWQFKTPTEIVNESLKAQKKIMTGIKGTTDEVGGSYKKVTEKVMNLDKLIKGSVEKNSKIVTIDLTRLGASLPTSMNLPTPQPSISAPAIATTVARTVPVVSKPTGGGVSGGFGASGSFGGPSINIEKVEINNNNPVTRQSGDDAWRYVKEAMAKDAAASGWPMPLE